MNNIQINGQRRWGPPESWTGPPPPHGTEIFIKNLPEHVFEFELYATFSCAGVVYEVRLPVNWDGLNRGYAFVRFTTVQEADEAIDTFDGYEIRRNRNIKVTRSVDNTRLFLSAVPVEKNSDDLKRDLLNYVENVKKVYVYPTLENRSLFRGYAFVEFETHRDAAIAKRILTPDVCYGIFEKKCIAAWAHPLPFLDRSLLKSLNVLFMRNIPKDIKSFQLKNAVENLTGGEEIKRVKKMNNFAFLTFKDHKSAERALYQLQSIPFLITDHETQVEWAIPREIVSPSFSTAEEEECEGPKKTRRGGERPNVEECIRDLETSVPRKARFTSHFNTSTQHDVDDDEFLESCDLILSNTHEVIPLVNSLDHSIVFRGKYGITMLSKNEKHENRYKIGPLNPKGALLPPVTVPSPSNGNSPTLLQNLCVDSTSMGDFSDSNPFKSKKEKLGISVGFSNATFGGSLHLSRNTSNMENTEMSTSFHTNFNPGNKYRSEDDFFSSVCSTMCPYSPVSPSVTTSRSSESPLHSPFFSDEYITFPSTMYEEIFPQKNSSDITASKTSHFGSELPKNAQVEQF